MSDYGKVEFRFRKMLKERGIKQQDIAERMGMHKQQVSRLATGIRMIDMGTLARLCKALEVTPGELLVYDPDGEE